MARVRVDTKGLEEVKDFMTSRAANLVGGNRTIEIYFDNTGRPAALNAHIAQLNSLSYGRNPFFLRPGERGHLTKIMKKGVETALRGRKRGFTGAVREAAKYIVEKFQQHLVSEDYNTPHKPLSDKYARWKKKKVGSEHPILFLYGSLYESIKFRLKKG